MLTNFKKSQTITDFIIKYPYQNLNGIAIYLKTRACYTDLTKIVNCARTYILPIFLVDRVKQ